MSTADPNRELDKLLIEQSSALLESSRQGGQEEQRRLIDWLSQSRRHVRTHLFMTALDEELKHIDPRRRMPIPEVVLTHIPSLPAPESVPASGARGKGRRSWSWPVAAAAALVAAAGAILTLTGQLGNSSQWQEFRTQVGEQRAIQLDDGSVVQLNTGSRVAARLSEQSRDIRLLNGEALFKVRHDPRRPFRVHASDVTIVAVGTQFNVYRSGEHTKVSVLEGRVRISAGRGPSDAGTGPSPAAPLVAAGEEAEIGKDGRIERRRTPDVENSAAWIQRRVVFKQEPLGQVVKEFNRYRKTPQFQVSDPLLASRKYSGTFDVDDPESLEAVLANERDLAIDRNGDAVVIRRRTPD